MIGWLLAGMAIGAAGGFLLAFWLDRRLWRTARRLRLRSHGRNEAAEMAQLAAGLAHEIKNPLSTINMNLRLLSEDIAGSRAPDRDRWLARLEGVCTEAGRLREVLDDFRKYAGRYELQLQPVDLRNTVSSLTDFFAPQADDARVVLRSCLPEEPVTARIDETLIKQALLNLMINATEAMAEGGELLIRLHRQRNTAVIEVIDTGAGIDPQDMEKVFQVYYSTRKTGSGLGLPTTRRIVREHGGDLHVQSEPGKGTRFVMRLPAGGPEPPAPPTEPDAQKP